MNIITLLHNLRNAVHDDSDTQTWCTANYGRNHKVLVGVDTRKPPAEASYPLVHLFLVKKTGGYELNEQSFIIGATCGIFNSELATTGKANVVEYQGIEHVETFRKYVENAIAGVDTGDLIIATLDIDYETIEFFPFFLVNMEIRFADEYVFGDGVFG